MQTFVSTMYAARHLFVPISAVARRWSSTSSVASSVVAAVPQELFPKSLGNVASVKDIILFQDDHIMIVYKPPGILSQPGRERGTPENLDLQTMLSLHLGAPFGTDNLIGLIHRLDRPASGLLIFAKTPIALRNLNRDFKLRAVEKRYFCVVNGEVTSPGNCEDFLLKRLVSNKTMVLTGTKSKKNAELARLSYKPIAPIIGSPLPQTALEVQLETGRRHQIRCQMEHRGWPLCGDGKYGAPQNFKLKDIALHAFLLKLKHPVGRQPLTFTCAPPKIWENRFGPEAIQAMTTRMRQESTNC